MPDFARAKKRLSRQYPQISTMNAMNLICVICVHPAQCLLGECFAESSDLRGVVVCVGGVDRSTSFQSCICRSRCACRHACQSSSVIRPRSCAVVSRAATEGFEGGRHVALVVTKLAGVLVLVVPLNDSIVFDEQFSQSGGGEAFAVAEVMNDFACTPFAGNRMRPQDCRRGSR